MLVSMADVVAKDGNGKGQPLSEDQLQLIRRVFETITPEIEALREAGSNHVVDMEVCRRFLVARQWKEKKAIAQLRKMLAWRTENKPSLMKLEDSPGCQENPYALNMRVCGYDKIGR